MTILNKDFLKKPISEARRQANRANAQKSTGPRTPEGKARSAQNTRTHGLTASLANPAHSSRDITALGEDRTLLPATIQSFLASWNPQTPYEASLVEDLATLRVRLKRCVRMESGLLDTEIPEISATDSHERINAALGASFSTQQQTFNRFSRYEANLSRAYDRTLKQLLAIRKAGLPPTSEPAPNFDQTNPSPIENKQPTPAPTPYEPNIRTINDPPAAPQDTTHRRHGQFTPFPEPPPRPVDLLWIHEDENGNEISQKW